MAILKDLIVNGVSRFLGKIFANKVNSNSFNNLLIGTGVAGQDKGSGISNRYVPSKWIFNAGVTLEDGDIYTIKIPVSGHDYGVYISIDGGSNFYPVVKTGTDRLTTHFSYNNYITVVFDSSGSCTNMFSINGGDSRIVISGGVFRILNWHDTNTTYGYIPYFTPFAGETIYRYKIIMIGEDNRAYPIVTTDLTSTTLVAKTPTNVGLRPDKAYFYSSTDTLLSGLSTLSKLQSRSNIAEICQYNFNTNINLYLNIYLRGTYNSTKGLFYLYNDGSNPCTSYYTQVPCNLSSITLSNYFVLGYYYLHIGSSLHYSNYLLLLEVNTFYYFDGTNLIPAELAAINTLTTAVDGIETLLSGI